MPISALRRAAEPGRAGGFTLIELLVALVLIGTLAGLVGPQIVTWLDRALFALALEDVELALAGLPARALADARRYQLTNAEIAVDGEGPARRAAPLPISLPAGWQLGVEAPITYRADGVCSGGLVTVIAADGMLAEYRLEAPHCIPERVPL